MKKYLEFILEARGSRASEKAANLGLVSDSHGGWLDRSGRQVAKTEGGELVFLKRKSPTAQKAAPPSPLGPSARQQAPIAKRQSPEREIAAPKEQEKAPDPSSESQEVLTFKELKGEGRIKENFMIILRLNLLIIIEI
jgi:hypothetical protein